MPELCSHDECTGCAACVNVCPNDAIAMVADYHGFQHPHIDAYKCIECKLCESVCPPKLNVKSRNSEDVEVYAAWYADEKVRIGSSSGGAFSALAQGVLNKGGNVYGAAWGTDLSVRHMCVSEKSQLHLLRKSKYLPSTIGNTYRRVKKDLKDGKIVLFSGTPCQVTGLYTFLRKADITNLYTVDVLCHGVPSPAVFTKYIQWIESKTGGKVLNVDFRDKRLGVECNLLIVFRLEEGREHTELFSGNSFYRAFVENVILRSACYKCKFNVLPRRADISLADFRGLGSQKPFAYLKDRNLGFSGLMVNNCKGRQLVKMSSDLCLDLRPSAELISSQPHLRHPAETDGRSVSFWKDWDSDVSYEKLALKYLKMSSKMRIMNLTRVILRPRLYYAISTLLKSRSKRNS